jgi:hypothetical protein
VSDEPSPWPERPRTQRLLFAAGVLLLVPTAVGLAGVVDPGGTVVVGFAAVASVVLVYALLGWAGTWAEREAGPSGPAESDERSPAREANADGDAGSPAEEADNATPNGDADTLDDDADTPDGDTPTDESATEV